MAEKETNLIKQSDIQALAEVFELARGNSEAIKSEATMANLINYRKDLSERIQHTLEKLK